jgi:hypothetical protein
MDNLVDIESDTARITLNRAIDRRLAEENPTNVAAE